MEQPQQVAPGFSAVRSHPGEVANWLTATQFGETQVPPVARAEVLAATRVVSRAISAEVDKSGVDQPDVTAVVFSVNEDGARAETRINPRYYTAILNALNIETPQQATEA